MAENLDDFYRAEKRIWDKHGLEPVSRKVRLASGGEVRVQEIGEGPPVVFIHGAAVGGTTWHDLAAALDGHRCILIDRPGCGLSDPIVGGPLRDLGAVHAYADGLLPELLDALELERASVASTSYGGMFAFRGAASVPERIDKIVEYSWMFGAPTRKPPLMTRFGGIPGMQAMMTRMPITAGMLKPMLKQFGMGKAIEAGTFDQDMLDWVLCLFRATDTMKNDMRSTPKLITLVKGFNKDLLLTDDLVDRLSMPILFLWGDEDPIGGGDQARQFAPRFANAELHVLPGAEHAPWFDDLDTCVSRTKAFLAG